MNSCLSAMWPEVNLKLSGWECEINREILINNNFINIVIQI